MAILITTKSNNYFYHMATIVRALWLAAKRALVSCNDRALLARCLRRVQSAFNLIVDILMGHSCYCRLTAVKKDIHWPVSHDCIAGSSVQLIEATCFLKLSSDQLLVLIDRRLRSIMKRPYNKQLNNLVRSVITGKAQSSALMYWPRYRSVNISRVSVWGFTLG